jgi:hypothetical protein
VKQLGRCHYEVNVLHGVKEFHPNLRIGICNRRPARFVYIGMNAVQVRAQMRGIIDERLFFCNETFNVAGIQKLGIRDNSRLKPRECRIIVWKQFKVRRNFARTA